MEVAREIRGAGAFVGNGARAFERLAPWLLSGWGYGAACPPWGRENPPKRKPTPTWKSTPWVPPISGESRLNSLKWSPSPN